MTQTVDVAAVVERVGTRVQDWKDTQIKDWGNPPVPLHVPDVEKLLDLIAAQAREIAAKDRALARIFEAHDHYTATNPAAKHNPDWLDDAINAARKATGATDE